MPCLALAVLRFPAVGSPLLGTGHVRRIMPCLEAPGRPAADVPVPARTQARRPADLGVTVQR